MSFFENARADWLSVNSGMGVKLCLKSWPRRISQMPSAVANNPATSLDSIVDLLTVLCFFEAQEIGAPLNVKSHPVVDFLSSRSPAKSASMYPARL